MKALMLKEEEEEGDRLAADRADQGSGGNNNTTLGADGVTGDFGVPAVDPLIVRNKDAVATVLLD